MSTTTANTNYNSSFCGISADSLANIASTSTGASRTVYRITLPAQEITFKEVEQPKKDLDIIQDVFFNEENGATTVKWKDGTITTVFCDEDDFYDKEKGLAMCVMKYFFGNDGRFNKVVKTFVPEVEHAVKTEKGYKIYTYRNAKVAAKKLNKPVNYILNRCEEDKDMNFIYDV